MNKLIRSAAALLTSLAMLPGTAPLFSIAEELSTVSGVLDTSDISFTFSECEEMQLTFDFPDILANADSDAPYFLGDYLDTNNKAVYDRLAELVTPSEESFTVKLPKSVSFSSSSLEISDNTDFYNAVFSSCVSAMEAVSFDLPLIFWMDNNHSSVSANNVKYSYNPLSRKYTFTVTELTVKPASYEGFESFSEVLEYKDVLEKAIADFPVEGETRAEKLRSIHDYICNFTVYDLKGRFSGSALSALVVPGAVCEGYSKGFKAICDDLGIPCVCIFGNYDEEKATAHMWNYVRMEDGYWYAVDVTWDDRDGKSGEELTDRFFLKGSDEFFEKHEECSEFLLANLTYPEIASWNYGEGTTAATTVPASAATTTTSTTSKPTTSTAKATTQAPLTTAAKSTATTAKPVTTATVKSTAAATDPAAASTVKSTASTKPTTTTRSTTKSTSTASTTIAATVSSAVTTTSAPASSLYGDVNQDGKVSIADLVYCALHVLGSDDAPNDCDLNGDGLSDAYDVILMRRIVIGIVTDTVKTGRQI